MFDAINGNRKIIKAFAALWLPLIILTLMPGCSGKGAGRAVSTITVTVTQTATVTVTPSAGVGKKEKAKLDPDDLVTPPEQEYKTDGIITDMKQRPEEKAVEELLKLGYITAFEDGTFKPDDPIKRSVYVLWLYNASGRKTPFARPEEPNFPDLPTDHWLFPIVEGIRELGGFKGYPDNTFKPGKHLTREEWCVMNVFFAADPQHVIDTVDTFPNNYKFAGYNDFKKVTKAGAKFVEYACSVGWTEKTFGKPMRKIPFDPEKPVTRAQAAKWIYDNRKELKIY